MYGGITPTATKPTSTTGGYKGVSATPVAPAPTASPTVVSKIVGGAKQVGADVAGVLNQPAPQSVPITPENYLAGAKDWGTNIIKGWQDFGNTLVHPQVTDSSFAVNAGADIAQSGVSFVKAFLTPVSDLFTKAASVPGPIGAVANGVNKVFGVAGVEGADAMEGAVNAIPFISQQTKDAITPVMKDIGSLGGQIILGKGGDMAKTEMVAKTKSVITAISHDPVLADHAAQSSTPTDIPAKPVVGNEITPTEPAPFHSDTPPAPTQSPVMPESPELLNPEAPKTMGEPSPNESTPARQLPVTREAPASPEITAPFKPNSASVEPQAAPSATELPKTADIPPAPADTLKTPVKEPGATLPENLTGTSKIGKSIEAKAVEAKLTQGFDQTAGYDKITIKDQAQKASNLINTSLDDARAVVRGDKPLPDGLRGSALVTAMEQHLVEHPSADIAHELANSPHVSGTSAAAQELRLAAERTPDSLTAKFKSIRDARKSALEKSGGVVKATKKVTSDIQTEIRKTASKRPTWEEFTKQLTCQI